MSDQVKIDSNITGLRSCQELTLGNLDPTPANQRWIEQEPNSYADFGGKITTVARNPINPSRQRKKGVVTNVEASASWDSDLTQENMQDTLQGFCYANFRRKQEFTGVQTVDTADDSYGATGIHTGYFAGDLVFASGYTNTANNGLKNVTAATGNKVTVSQNLVNETSPAASKLVAVGYQFPSDVSITNPGTSYPTLVSPTKDLTQLGINPGETIWVGGDTTLTRFALNAPFLARVRSVAAGAMVFDKTSITLVADDGTSTGSGGTANKTVQLFKGRVLKNEVGSSIVRRSYRLERTLGYNTAADVTREQAEYVVGAVPNDFEITYNSADKLVCTLSFLGLRSDTIDENVSGANSLLSKISGVVRVPVTEADAFNTSSDISRVSLRTVSTTDANPSALFTYSEDITITIKNNNTPNNAIGVLGAFEITAGMFEVGGEINAYFGDVAAVTAVRNNADVSLDIFQSRANSGISLDIPLITLGGGLLKVEQDQAIKIPLETSAVTGAKIDPTLNHTIMFVFFDYLPTVAAA